MTDPISNERLADRSAPDRIWATVNGASTRLPDGGRQLIGGWSEDKDRPRAVEYVRADLARRQSPAGVEVSEQMLIDAFLRGESWRKRNDVDRYVAVPEMVNKAARDYADATLSCLSVEPAGVEPVAWQRRLKYSDVAGAVPQWQNCSAAEATGHFENSPYHEYRSLYASPPKAVTITDEMVERGLAEYSEGGCSGLADYERREVVVSILTAALSSEAHNGRE